MATNTHSELITDEVHVPYRQIFANATARINDATEYTSYDLYKTAYQEDTSAEYILTSISPVTWTAIAAAGTIWAVSGGVTSNTGSLSTPDTDDFVFGSDSLDDTGVVAEDNRMLFDKSKAAFRVGSATSTHWDNTNRGSFSAALGLNNTAAADYCSITGGSGNNINSGSDYSCILSGDNNSVTATHTAVFGSNVSGKYLGALSFGASNVTTQSNIVHWGDATLGVGPTELFLDGSSAQYVLADNQRVGFCIYLIAARSATATQAMYKFEGLAERGTGAGLDASVSADVTTGAIIIQATGILAQVWNWSATGIMMDATG